MIRTVLQVCQLRLRRDRPAWLLVFVVPVLFFSIFAVIFGGISKAGMPRIGVAVVDEDGSELSRRLVSAIGQEPSLNVQTARDGASGGPLEPLTRSEAERMVRQGTISTAIILPKGLGTDFPRFDGQ